MDWYAGSHFFPFLGVIQFTLETFSNKSQIWCQSHSYLSCDPLKFHSKCNPFASPSTHQTPSARLPNLLLWLLLISLSSNFYHIFIYAYTTSSKVAMASGKLFESDSRSLPLLFTMAAPLLHSSINSIQSNNWTPSMAPLVCQCIISSKDMACACGKYEEPFWN